MAGNFLMEHNFSPRWSGQHQRSGSHGQGSDDGSRHGHFGLDSLAHFIHAFNAHGGDKATHAEPKVHPLFDLVESHDDFKIYGELPGMTSDHLHVDVNDHLFIITVSGKFDVPTEIAALQGKDAVPITHKDAGTPGGKVSEEAKKEPAEVTEAPAKTEPAAESSAAATAGEGAEQAKETPKEEDKEEKPKIKYHIHERKLGSFKRAFQFPVEVVSMEKVSAQCRNGLLTITVPKNPAPVERKGRKLDVV